VVFSRLGLGDPWADIAVSTPTLSKRILLGGEPVACPIRRSPTGNGGPRLAVHTGQTSGSRR
jgi:hypothetical protein